MSELEGPIEHAVTNEQGRSADKSGFDFRKNLIYSNTFDPHEVAREIAPLLPSELPSRQILEKYRTQASWFMNTQQVNAKLHDIGHHARVLVWGDVLLTITQRKRRNYY